MMIYKYSSGFTLLEVLVVLVIMGLLSTLLLEGFSFVLTLRVRLLSQLQDVQQSALQEYGFRNSTAALVPDYYNGKNLFQGSEHELSGLTMAPLEASIGELLPFAWQIQHQQGMTTLRYRKSDGEYWEIAHWPGEEGKFLYQDEEGQWHSQWPPHSFSTSVPQLPRLILLQGQRRQIPMTWIVSLTDNTLTVSDLRLQDQ